MAKRSAQVIDHPMKLPEPPILSDTALAQGLAKMRLHAGGYWSVTPEPGLPDLDPQRAELRAALRRWHAAGGDPAYAAAVGRALVGSFPSARVDCEAYAAGLAAIAEDEHVSADIVRAVCRRVRAEQRSLPPLADLRTEMLAEVAARGRLLTALNDYPRAWQAERAREMEEAERIAQAAARVGVEIGAEAVRDGWHGLSAVCFLQDRHNTPPLTVDYFEDNVIRAIASGGPHAAEAARLLALVAPHERARETDLAEGRRRFVGLPQDAPEWREWDAAWPTARERFGAECDALADALGLKHSHDLT